MALKKGLKKGWTLVLGEELGRKKTRTGWFLRISKIRSILDWLLRTLKIRTKTCALELTSQTGYFESESGFFIEVCFSEVHFHVTTWTSQECSKFFLYKKIPHLLRFISFDSRFLKLTFCRVIRKEFLNVIFPLNLKYLKFLSDKESTAKECRTKIRWDHQISRNDR